MKKAPMIFVGMLLVVLNACGFEPVHGKHTSNSKTQTNATLKSINVQVDRSRLGQLLEAELKDQLNPSRSRTDKRYLLKITLTETEGGAFINPDGTSSRNNISFTTTYNLIDLESDKVIDGGDINRISSYNLSELADFATYVAQQDARKRGILELARSYKLRLLNTLSVKK